MTTAQELEWNPMPFVDPVEGGMTCFPGVNTNADVGIGQILKQMGGLNRI